MTNDERYYIMFDEIYDLKNTILNIQTILKNEGFDDIESMIAKYKNVLYDSNEIAIQKDEQIESLTAQLKKMTEYRNECERQYQEQIDKRGEELEEYNIMKAQLKEAQEQRDKAVEDVNVMALAMRESDELSEGCCFACIFDAQNLPDNTILPYGECPGYETNKCFEWRGLGKDGKNDKRKR